MKTEDYHSEEYSEIIFSYKIPTSDFKVKRKSKLNIYDRNVKMALDHLNYTGLNIPNTMDFST
jgi:hypothetical protein